MARLACRAFVLAVLPTACATAPAKPEPAPPPQTRHKMVDPLQRPGPEDEGMKVAGLLGSLEQDAIERGVSSQLLEAQHCFDQEARRRPYLGGKVVLQYRVAIDGRVKALRISESTLGSYEVERCLLEVMKQAAFSRPSGGEAEFGYTLIFPERVAVQVWDPGMVVDEIASHRRALLAPDRAAFRRRAPASAPRGRKGRRGRRKRGNRQAPAVEEEVDLVAPVGLLITFYVDHRGRVLCAGLVADELIDEEFGQKFIENLRRVTFVATQTRYAKVTVRW